MTEAQDQVTIDQLMSPEQIRLLQIITGAFMSGIFIFTLVVLFLFLNSATPEPGSEELRNPGGDTELLHTLSLAHAAVVLCCWPAGTLLYRRFTSRKALLSGSNTIYEASIMRLGFLEGPGLFGCVIFMLAGMGREVDDSPLLWLNLLSPVASITFMALTFPTKKNLESLPALSPEGTGSPWANRAEH